MEPGRRQILGSVDLIWGSVVRHPIAFEAIRGTQDLDGPSDGGLDPIRAFPASVVPRVELEMPHPGELGVRGLIQNPLDAIPIHDVGRMDIDG